MAFSILQHPTPGTGVAGPTAALAWASAPTNGKLLVCVVVQSGTGTVTESTTQGWILASSVANGVLAQTDIWYRVAGAGETTAGPSFNIGAGNAYIVEQAEVSGWTGTPTLDKTGSATGNIVSTLVAAVGVATTAATEFVFGACANAEGNTAGVTFSASTAGGSATIGADIDTVNPPKNGEGARDTWATSGASGTLPSITFNTSVATNTHLAAVIATFKDVASGGTPISGADTVAGADAPTTLGLGTPADSGAGADAATNVLLSTPADAVSLADQAVVGISAANAAVIADTPSLVAPLASDVGGLADQAAISSPTNSADAGAGADAPTLIQFAVSDAAVAVDAGLVALTGAEVSTGADLATSVVLAGVAEASGLADAPAIAVAHTDTAVGADAIPGVLLIGAVESAGIADAPAISITGADMAAGTDTTSNVLLTGAVEVAALADAGSQSIVGGTLVSAADTAASTDTTSGLVASPNAAEVGTVAESAVVLAVVSQGELGMAVDVAVLVSPLPTGTEIATIADSGAAAPVSVTQIAAADSALIVDLAGATAVVTVGVSPTTELASLADAGAVVASSVAAPLAAGGGHGRPVVLAPLRLDLNATDTAHVRESAAITAQRWSIAASDQAQVAVSARIHVTAAEMVAVGDLAIGGDNFWTVNRDVLAAEIDEDLLLAS